MLSVHLRGKVRKLSKGLQALVALCVLASLCGCAAQWLQSKLEVDRAAVREVHRIGDVVAQTTAEYVYGNTVQVAEILIVDVGKTSFSEAIKTAEEGLLNEGWVVTRRSVDQVDMKSRKWEKVMLSVGPLELLEPYHAEMKPDVAQAVKDHKDGVGVYLLVDLSKAQ